MSKRVFFDILSRDTYNLAMHKAQHHPDHGEGALEVLTTDLESQRVTFFGDEYKPDVKLDFAKMKAYLAGPNIFIRRHSLDSLLELCDVCLAKQIGGSITDLEGLSGDQKRSLADFLLEMSNPQTLHTLFGEAMLFRVWHRWYSWAYKHKQLAAYIQKCSTFAAWSQYRFLAKAYDAQWQLFMHMYDIGVTLHQFDMGTHLDPFLQSDWAQSILEDTIGKAYQLVPLYAKGEHTSGHEQNWRYKHFDANGKEIDEEEVGRARTYDRTSWYKFHKQANYTNHHIHRDRSGEEYALYMDAPMGIGLFHSGKPLAFIAFSLRDRDALMINQMQSVKVTHYDKQGRVTHEAVNPLVATLPRQHLLTKVTELFASQYGCTKIKIQSGANNKRTKELRNERVFKTYSGEIEFEPTDHVHLSQQNAHRIYDLFAQKQGYTLDDERGDWIKDL